MPTSVEKQREYVRGHYLRNRQSYIDRAAKRRMEAKARIDLLKSVPCADCGVAYPPYVMDFDHREGEEKSGNIANMYQTRAWATVLAEIEKCDVVCSNCHRVRTHNRNIRP